MNDNLYNEITIVIVLYEEEFELINRCLDNIKNFNIIFDLKKIYIILIMLFDYIY